MEVKKNVKNIIIATAILFLFLFPPIAAIENNSNLKSENSNGCLAGMCGGFKKIRLIIINNGDEATDGYYEVSISSSISNRSYYINESFSVSAGQVKFIPVRIGWFLRGKAYVHLTADALPGVHSAAWGYVFLGFIYLPYRTLQ